MQKCHQFITRLFPNCDKLLQEIPKANPVTAFKGGFDFVHPQKQNTFVLVARSVRIDLNKILDLYIFTKY